MTIAIIPSVVDTYFICLLACADVPTLLEPNADESSEVEIGVDEPEGVYDVRRPMNIVSNGGNEGISPMVSVNGGKGGVNSRREFLVVDEQGNYGDSEEDFHVDGDVGLFTPQQDPILDSFSTLVPTNNNVSDGDIDLTNRTGQNLPEVIAPTNINVIGGDAGAFRRDCLLALRQADDLADLGHRVNEIDEDTFDLGEVAREISVPVDPTNPSSLSVGQYCIDQLMILNVSNVLFSVFNVPLLVLTSSVSNHVIVIAYIILYFFTLTLLVFI